MIRRWKAMKKPQLCYLTHFFIIPYGLRAVLNIHNSIVLEFSFFWTSHFTTLDFFRTHKWTSSRSTRSTFSVMFFTSLIFFLTCLIFVLFWLYLTFRNVFQSAFYILIRPLYVKDELNFTEEETEPIEINKVNFWRKWTSVFSLLLFGGLQRIW